MRNPFAFIVGCPRSGTTLLRRIVNAHPRVAVIPEIGWIVDRYERRDGVSSDGFVDATLVRDLAEKGRFGRYTKLPVTRDELERLAASRPIRYAELIAWLFDRYGQQEGKELVCNKTVDHVRNVGVLHELFPDARIVHLVRDGRDVCLSAIGWRRALKLAQRFATWDEDPISTAALWWEWHVRLGREAGSTQPGGWYYELRYEALVERPAKQCMALCAFLGLPYDEAMLRFHEGRERGDARLDAKHAWLPPTRGLRDWRTQMRPEDVERFEAIAGDLLDELGYPLGTRRLSRASLRRAGELRSRFEGRPLPRGWQLRGGLGRSEQPAAGPSHGRLA